MVDNNLLWLHLPHVMRYISLKNRKRDSNTDDTMYSEIYVENLNEVNDIQNNIFEYDSENSEVSFFTAVDSIWDNSVGAVCFFLL